MTVPLVATYRLQLGAGFTLHDARARVPYLKRLGISHLYLSPALTARAGSTHGYDVTDPTQVSAALGGDDAFIALAADAHANGLGIVLDIVPNHMGTGPDNPFWDDVLKYGPASRYASWFDVAWRAPTRRLQGKVLVPVLGDTMDHVLEREEIRLDVMNGAIRVRYFEHHFPVAPETLPSGLTPETLDEWGEGAGGRARLAELLSVQHYELGYWRSAHRDLNYRRFFDVNELISLRVERPEVFDATHRTVLRFVADGLVDGLRVDHVDGLLEPSRYLERLRAAVDERHPPRGADRFPIFVEKILAPVESLPRRWPVDGTTGYEFLTSLEDVFIDARGHAMLEARYRRGGCEGGFREVAVDSKRRVLRTTLNADIRRVAPMLANVAQAMGSARRPVAAYARVIVEVSSVLSVYRTYIDEGHPEPDERDRRVLMAAIAEVRQDASAGKDALDVLEQVLLGNWRDAEAGVLRERLQFVLRWQQLTGPAAARGVEDTALYVYAPLTSRNEVGGDPSLPLEGAVARLHARLRERADSMPRCLNATNTHDTKRSADVRARIDVLSLRPAEWERALRRWRRQHRSLRTKVRGRLAPTPAADDFLYQAILGLWAAGPTDAAEGTAWLDDTRERLLAYGIKAAREAKVGTSWIDPDVQYEAAIERFITGVLDRSANARFLDDMDAFAAKIAPQALWNALARLVVHLAAPGVPDIYQGDEIWFTGLVDPDNRRPVDWSARERSLEAVSPQPDGAQLGDWRDSLAADELKMAVLLRLLAARREYRSLFEAGTCEPLKAKGDCAERLVAFRRSHGEAEAVILVPRLLESAFAARPTGEGWGDTTLQVASGGRWRCAIQGVFVRSDATGRLSVRDAFRDLPVAVLLPVK